MKENARHGGWCAAAVVAAALAVSCDELPTEPAQSQRMPVKGVTLVDWSSDGFARASAREALADIARAGANTVVLIRTAYQASASADVVEVRPRTPTIASLEAAASEAAALGLRVVIKPHVDLDDGSWRGNIDPQDVAAWFASYAEFVLEAALLAQRVGAAQLVVGTEMAGTIEREDLWRSLIALVREAYSGEVVYAASWDNAARIGFWDALDAVGVDFYGAVARRDQPGRVELLAGWQPWIDRLHRLHRLTGKRILLTEIGYRSVDGAGQAPFAFGTDERIDTGEQADLYWAALEALGGRRWIEGVYWWNWLASGEGGADNDDYTPKGKPAQEELERAWK